MTAFEPVTLSGTRVRLEPLAHAHASDLAEAVRDGELWRLWYTTIPPPEKMSAEIDRRLGLAAEGKMLPFAVIDLVAGTAVGMTTFLNIDAVNKRVEIGATWYRQRAQRTEINTQCKLLLLTHAFERLDCIAVEFRTHFFNHASRRGKLARNPVLAVWLAAGNRAEVWSWSKRRGRWVCRRESLTPADLRGAGDDRVDHAGAF